MAPTTKASAKAKKAPAKAAKKATTASKATGKKATPAKKAATPAKKAPAKAPAKAAAKKAPAKKAPAKAAARKAPAKKAPAKAPAKQATPSPTRVIPALAKRAPADSTRKAPPKRKGPLDKFLLGQLEALKEERVTYLRQAESLKAEADLLAAEREPGDVQFDEESGEGDTLAVERERDLALSAQASAAVEEIDRAIAKLHDGTYGVCEQCYSTIPKERLRALPYAALCVQCKSAGFARR
jgi:RNA polymerase-binding transcription factor DksA